MVLKGVQSLHLSSLNISTKGVDSECQQCKRHVFLPSLFFSSKFSSKKRIARGVKWVYDHLGRIWMSFRCRSDVVSDVVQIASGFQKFKILLCDRSRPSETSGHTNNKPDVQILPEKCSSKSASEDHFEENSWLLYNRHVVLTSSHMSMYDLDVVLDVVPDVVPQLNGIPSKQLKAQN